MKQQINLYQEQFREKPVTLPARQMAMIAGGLLAVMTVVSGGMGWMNQQAAQRHAELSGSTEALKQANDQLQAKLTGQAVEPALAAGVEEAARQLQARQKIMQWMEKSQENLAVPFSALLEGLSRQHVQGLWLTFIGIENGGQGLHLQGSSLDPKLIPDFLGRLKNETAYQGREFRKVMMRADENDPAVLNFALTTDKPDEKNFAALETALKGTR
ncbi:MAG TPA: PilN domain-containing protein [Gammaproteobacteria bacterium]